MILNPQLQKFLKAHLIKERKHLAQILDHLISNNKALKAQEEANTNIYLMNLLPRGIKSTDKNGADIQCMQINDHTAMISIIQFLAHITIAIIRLLAIHIQLYPLHLPLHSSHLKKCILNQQ